MKYTSEMLMKAMGLQVGDRVKINDKNIFIVDSSVALQSIETGYYTDIVNLVDQDYELLTKSKRVGNTNGDDYENCINCPLRLFDYCGNYCDGNLSLYEVLEQSTKYVKRKGLFDQEIYDIFKKRLDKEVVEDNE